MEPAVDPEAGVVHEHLEVRSVCQDRGDEPRAIVVAGEVGDVGGARRPVDRLQRRRHLPQPRLAPRDEQQVVAAPGEPVGECAPDPAGGTGDDGERACGWPGDVRSWTCRARVGGAVQSGAGPRIGDRCGRASPLTPAAPGASCGDFLRDPDALAAELRSAAYSPAV